MARREAGQAEEKHERVRRRRRRRMGERSNYERGRRGVTLKRVECGK